MLISLLVNFAHDPKLQLTGKILDDIGVPIQGVSVQLESGGEVVAKTETNRVGWFIFQGLPDRFSVTCQIDGYEDWTKEFETPPHELVVIRMNRKVSAAPTITASYDVLKVAPRSAATSSVFRADELERLPVETPGDVLRVIPGMVVAQHGGGGKSDQYLIRGFDADHGTDFALFLEGIPVNMVSHAHGQGYADLSFMIPETLQKVEVFKGAYFSEFGNLGTAGSANLRLRDSFGSSFVKLQGGNFDTQRMLAVYDADMGRGHGYVAAEGFFSDGPFNDPQDMERLNFVARYNLPLGEDQNLTLFATGYDGSWYASGQIPLREVESGRLDRFGAVDPTEGGDSSRFNISLAHNKQWESQSLSTQVYLSAYDMNLYSNFTFLLNNPVDGDGIQQVDDRTILGTHVQYSQFHEFGGLGLGSFRAGFYLRDDDIDVGLFHQRERNRLGTVVDSRVKERNTAFYAQEELSISHNFKTIVGLRYDRFDFDVADVEGGPSGKRQADIVQPKVSLIFNALSDHSLQIFLNYGRGFHSNDARSAVADTEAVVLAASDGYELGFQKVFGDFLEINLAYWWLDLEGELVWVGDEGTTELGGPSRRYGPELEIHWKIDEFWFVDFDLNDITAEDEETGLPIARAPRTTANAGIHYKNQKGWRAGLRARHIDDIPLDDEGRVKGEGFTIADLTLSRQIMDRLEISFSVENLFDSEYMEAQTWFESRLPNETQPVADNHFTPGSPFTLRLGIDWNF
ncbi:MAG: TonB-dependent receptor [Acidobacteriota bacterium]|nr:TonB-dependent receptor [Acidobacteriota bacterium]